MPETSPERRRLRSEAGGRTRWHGPNHPSTLEAKRDLAATTLAEHIERVLAQAPPLSEEQRTKLAELLKPARLPR